MRLQLLHPAVAARSCEKCKEDWYDDAWKGDKFVFSLKVVGSDRKGSRGVGQKRPPHLPTPCEHCPKKSPENAKKLELSERNLAAIDFYHRTKACGGRNLTEEAAADETLVSNLTIINAIHKQHERLQQGEILTGLVEVMAVAMGAR